MKIRDIMTRKVETARAEEPIQSIAQRMAKGGFGFMPVCEGDRTVVGTITDRDLTIRALAGGLSPSTPVGVVMTTEVTSVHEDDDLTDVLDKMGEEQIRRMPVLSARRELCGVVSIGDLALNSQEKLTGAALEEISKRGPTTFG